jgi:DNA-directed RNA polymerase specialized sigma24 family protein
MASVLTEIDEAMAMVRRRARRYAGTQLGYEDAVGEGYLALVEAQRTFDPSRGVPRMAYLSRVVGWRMVDAHRRLVCRGLHRLPWVMVPTPDWVIIERLGGREPSLRLLDIRERMRTLNDHQMGVVAMRAAGYDDAQIAEVYGISKSGIAQIFMDVRRKVL